MCVGKDEYEEALELPDAHPMDFTGKPILGEVLVEPSGSPDDVRLEEWVGRGGHMCFCRHPIKKACVDRPLRLSAFLRPVR